MLRRAFSFHKVAPAAAPHVAARCPIVATLSLTTAAYAAPELVKESAPKSWRISDADWVAEHSCAAAPPAPPQLPPSPIPAVAPRAACEAALRQQGDLAVQLHLVRRAQGLADQPSIGLFVGASRFYDQRDIAAKFNNIAGKSVVGSIEALEDAATAMKAFARENETVKRDESSVATQLGELTKQLKEFQKQADEQRLKDKQEADKRARDQADKIEKLEGKDKVKDDKIAELKSENADMADKFKELKQEADERARDQAEKNAEMQRRINENEVSATTRDVGNLLRNKVEPVIVYAVVDKLSANHKRLFAGVETLPRFLEVADRHGMRGHIMHLVDREFADRVYRHVSGLLSFGSDTTKLTERVVDLIGRLRGNRNDDAHEVDKALFQKRFRVAEDIVKNEDKKKVVVESEAARDESASDAVIECLSALLRDDFRRITDRITDAERRRDRRRRDRQRDHNSAANAGGAGSSSARS
jgi:hypothetical protein